jgi:hypothetical protein
MLGIGSNNTKKSYGFLKKFLAKNRIAFITGEGRRAFTCKKCIQ